MIPLNTYIPIIKFFFSLICAVPGLCILGLYFYMQFIIPSKQFVPFSLKGSNIGPAVQYVNNFQKANKKLPNNGEFYTWEKETLKLDENAVGLSYVTPPYPDDVLKKFGEPPTSSFLVGYWTGGVNAYYVPWSGKNNVAYIFDEEYFIAGSASKDFLLFLALSSVFFVPSICLLAISLASKTNKCFSQVI